jgi:histidine kinase/DNA gyrase B/HSP90-like ATPase
MSVGVDVRRPRPAEIVEPHADALVESLRAFGYSPETAIADLVDNSLAAAASNVAIQFQWSGASSWIAVLDDGTGMTAEELREAMRAGASNPLAVRERNDLGRFGLGLKTASFSQCRLLTVSSAVYPDQSATRVWDLDHVGETKRWELLTEARPRSAEIGNRLLGKRTGTLVLWENLDRIVGQQSSGSEVTERHFYKVVDRVAAHLGMVFHRYLTASGRVSITVNGREVRAWDPFGSDLSATQLLGEELLDRDNLIMVRPYVLPHPSKLTQQRETELAGPGGWVAQQGFYVYRNRRLIVAGDWLGLRLQRLRSARLARVQLDLPNTLDQEWQIDVRKSVARPPAHLTDQLHRIAEVTRARSEEVYRHRGKLVNRNPAEGVTFAWEQVVHQGRVSYRVNRNHPIVSILVEDGRVSAAAETLLRLLEETVPVPMILQEHISGESRHAEPFEGPARQALQRVAVAFVRSLRLEGLNSEQISARMLATEPFSDHPGLVAELTEQEWS